MRLATHHGTVTPPDECRKGHAAGMHGLAGFTIAELVIVIAIIGLLAAVVVPTLRFGFRRQKEVELHERIRTITTT